MRQSLAVPRDHLVARDDFDAVQIIQPMASAPRDGTIIVARDRRGYVFHIRWCIGADLDDDMEPYWGRMDTDEPFQPIAWSDSTWTDEDFCKVYN